MGHGFRAPPGKIAPDSLEEGPHPSVQIKMVCSTWERGGKWKRESKTTQKILDENLGCAIVEVFILMAMGLGLRRKLNLGLMRGPALLDRHEEWVFLFFA